MGEFCAPGAEIWLFKKTNMDRSIDLAVQHIEKVLCVGGYNWLLCGVSGKEEKNMVAPPLVKAGVLCRGVLLLGCCGAGGGGEAEAPPRGGGRAPPGGGLLLGLAAIRDAACPLWRLRAVALQILFSRFSVSVRSRSISRFNCGGKCQNLSASTNYFRLYELLCYSLPIDEKN